MFDSKSISQAKMIFDSSAKTGDRIGAGLDMAGDVMQFAQAQKGASAQEDAEREKREEANRAKMQQAAMGVPGPPPMPEGLEKIVNSQGAQTLKKVASAVASYYTGGLASLGQNIAGQVVNENNPRAGALLSIAGKALG